MSQRMSQNMSPYFCAAQFGDFANGAQVSQPPIPEPFHCFTGSYSQGETPLVQVEYVDALTKGFSYYTL
jgi:hypothetical protein